MPDSDLLFVNGVASVCGKNPLPNLLSPAVMVAAWCLLLPDVTVVVAIAIRVLVPLETMPG